MVINCFNKSDSFSISFSALFGWKLLLHILKTDTPVCPKKAYFKAVGVFSSDKEHNLSPVEVTTKYRGIF